jgi:cyclic pyranopterin phosphate synthase
VASPLQAVTLRVSLLEQCQYDCGYCRPGSVVGPTHAARWLRAADYERLASLFGALGVHKVRFTGGEPLLRPDVVDVVRAFRTALPGRELALTTNGQRLPSLLEPLATAGLDRATVHVDSLRPERYRTLMGDGVVGEVLAGVLAARDRLRAVKLNVVVQRGRNDDELLDFLSWSQRTGVEVRFIELMNTGSAVDYTRQVFVSGAEILALVARGGPVRLRGRRHTADPAALYETSEGVVFGIIASDTQPFCESCDRLRLTADGRLRGCLYEQAGVPLGAALKAGASDDDLRAMLELGLARKRSHHPLRVDRTHAFSMADTGG